MGGPTSKDRGMDGGENRGGEGSRGKGKERAMSPSTIWRKFTPMTMKYDDGFHWVCLKLK